MGNQGSNRRTRYCTGDSEANVYTPDELEFMRAMDAFKREQRQPFPTLAETLAVLKSLGYAKPAAASTAKMPSRKGRIRKRDEVQINDRGSLRNREVGRVVDFKRDGPGKPVRYSVQFADGLVNGFRLEALELVRRREQCQRL